MVITLFALTSYLTAGLSYEDCYISNFKIYKNHITASTTIAIATADFSFALKSLDRLARLSYMDFSKHDFTGSAAL